MSDPIIHVSFPQPPDAYPKTLHWHAQLSRHVFEALQQQFGTRVRFSPWSAPLEPAGSDVLVSFLPHPALKDWKRSVLIENSNFDTDKWRFAAFRRFGLNAPVDSVRETEEWMRHQFAALVLSNDVAIRRVAARDPQVADCHDHMVSLVRHLSVHPHPIDKVEFSRLADGFPLPPKVRMLVYHGGPRKNSAELIQTLRDIGLQENGDFSVAAHVPKGRADLMAFLRQNFLIVGNTSYSETGPINMIEYLLSGFAVYGHDDWWDGAETRASAGPTTRRRSRRTGRTCGTFSMSWGQPVWPPNVTACAPRFWSAPTTIGRLCSARSAGMWRRCWTATIRAGSVVESFVTR
ncbi:hypothetical protein ACHMW5_11225 [Azospirillum melinis]|uniref:hypothetical protein n=1 Tax=Azospirillum melinis TaxID=328839 RepID=UPI003756C4D2